jgi:hypothetical protein
VGARCWLAVLVTALADFAWTVVMLAIAGGLLYLAFRMNARTRVHRRAEDGSWFSCEVQQLAPNGEALGSWRSARAEVVAGGLTIVGTVAGDGIGPGDAPRPVVGRSEAPPRGWAVFLVSGSPLLALRVPAGSPTVARLDDLRVDR